MAAKLTWFLSRYPASVRARWQPPEPEPTALPDPLKDRLALTVDEAAEILGVGRNTAYAAVRSGQIPSFRIGNSIRVPAAKLDKMLKGISQY